MLNPRSDERENRASPFITYSSLMVKLQIGVNLPWRIARVYLFRYLQQHFKNVSRSGRSESL